MVNYCYNNIRHAIIRGVKMRAKYYNTNFSYVWSSGVFFGGAVIAGFSYIVGAPPPGLALFVVIIWGLASILQLRRAKK